MTALLLIMLAFIWGNSLLSREASGSASNTLLIKLNTAAQRLGLGEDFFTCMRDVDGDGIREQPSYYIRKAAHVTEFALLAAVLWGLFALRGERRFLYSISSAVLCAAADETIQIFSRRGSQVSDVLIDSVGALLGIGIAALAGGIWKNAVTPVSDPLPVGSADADSPGRP